MDNPEINFLGDLARLELKPGDQFVLTVPYAVSKEVADRITHAWDEFVGGDDKNIKLMILQDGMKIGVINLTPPVLLGEQ